MALSEDEKRLLAQLEASLAAEDPHLADTLRGTGTRSLHRRRAALAGLGFVIGIVALVAGLRISPIVSVAGFIVMLAAAIIAISSWQHVNDIDPVEKSSAPKQPAQSQADSVQQFMEKMEERWRRRQDEGR
ncbi:MAG: DUF3040 domain-containing protein [Propionibacteriaceae bacterium]|nr:DUF3040 domain-containing protein [Propionibacteriaceae bacterium]